MQRRNQYEFPRCRGADFQRLNNFQRNQRQREFVFREHDRHRQRFRRFLLQSWVHVLDGASRVPDNVS